MHRTFCPDMLKVSIALHILTHTLLAWAKHRVTVEMYVGGILMDSMPILACLSKTPVFLDVFQQLSSSQITVIVSSKVS